MKNQARHKKAGIYLQKVGINAIKKIQYRCYFSSGIFLTIQDSRIGFSKKERGRKNGLGVLK